MLCLEAHECPAERAGLQKERSREKERRERERNRCAPSSHVDPQS